MCKLCNKNPKGDMKKLLVIVVMFAALSVAFAQTPSASLVSESNFEPLKKVYTNEYFPLLKNKTLVYKSNVGETVSKVTYTGGEYVLSNESDDFTYTQNFVKKSDGIYFTRTHSEVSVLMFGSESILTYEKPVLKIPFPLEEGKTWQWKGTEFCDGESNTLIIDGKFAGTETVTTKAGTFETIKIVTKINSVGGSKSTLTEWLAPGIGIVKSHAVIDGSGVTGVFQDLLGYDVIDFELISIR